MKIEATILNPTVPEARNLTQEDVWGKVEHSHWKDKARTEFVPAHIVSHGMKVATSHEDGLPTICPVWGDTLKYKSVTIICRPCLEEEVKYWLEYVHGGGSVSRRKVISKNEIALRSDYQC